MNQLLYVLYDSVTNSVFDGQVAQPLLTRLHNNPTLHITLVSYERHPRNKQLHTLAPKHERLHVHIIRQLPFVGTLSLRYAAHKLKLILKKHSDYTLIARGPLAGWICLHARKNATPLTIQARGLLAQEYAYEHRDTKSFVHSFRSRQFNAVEQHAYGTHAPNVTIEAVSTALRDYIVTTFNAQQAEHMTIAHQDLPHTLSDAERTAYRTDMRKKLNIAPDAHVLCYNGSAKAWQRPDQVVRYFKNFLPKNPYAVLVILSRDRHVFEHLLNNAQIASTQYRLCSVTHTQVIQYLAACDTGILLRDNHIINWVSRPTKVLEYQAAGLNIVHNNTIALLAQDDHQPGQPVHVPVYAQHTQQPNQQITG